LVFFANDAVKAARVQSLAESSRALLTFFVSGELGRVSDAVGRVPLVVLSVICTLAPLLALLTTSNLYPYFVLFSLAGALGGQSSPAVKAYVADCCGERQRMYSFALIGACVSTVTVVGPLIGAWLDAHPGREALFQVAVGLELVAGLFAFVLPESLPTEKRRQFQVSEGLQTCAPLRVLVRSLMQGGCTSRLLWLQALRGLSSNGLITVLAFVLAQTVDFTSADFGMIMSVVGVMGIVGQAVFLPAFKHFGMREIHILTVALVVSFFQACAFMGLSIWPYKWYAYIIQPIDAMAFLADPAFSTMVTQGQTEDYGLLLGLVNSVDGLTSFLGPLMFSFAFSIHPFAPFGVAATFRLAALVLLLLSYKGEEEQHRRLSIQSAEPLNGKGYVSPSVPEAASGDATTVAGA